MYNFSSAPSSLFASHTDPQDRSDDKTHRAERLQAASSLEPNADRRPIYETKPYTESRYIRTYCVDDIDEGLEVGG
jgi:hypothetical protein